MSEEDEFEVPTQVSWKDRRRPNFALLGALLVIATGVAGQTVLYVFKGGELYNKVDQIDRRGVKMEADVQLLKEYQAGAQAERSVIQHDLDNLEKRLERQEQRRYSDH